MSDIDIARKAKKIHIRDVASKINTASLYSQVLIYELALIYAI